MMRSKVRRSMLTVSRYEQLLDRDRRGDEALFSHVADERLECRTVRFDAIGPAIAAKQRVDFFNICREPRQHVAQRAGGAHFLPCPVLGCAESGIKARRQERMPLV